MSVVTVQQMADRVSALLGERLRVRGDTLEARLKKAGRRLPRKVRDAGAELVQATQMIRNPKLRHLVDDAVVAAAYDTCLRHLTTVNPNEARITLLVGIAAHIAFSLLVVAVLVIVTLYWRGFI